MYNDPGSKAVCVPPRLTIGGQTVEKLRILLNRADTLSERVAGALAAVIRQPEPLTGAECIKQGEWPPLFAEMRGIMESIDCAFNRIEDVLNRVEL